MGVHVRMYFVFAGSHDHPCGGMGDYVNSFSTLEDAVRATTDLIKKGEDWYQIAHLDDGKLVVLDTFVAVTAEVRERGLTSVS